MDDVVRVILAAALAVISMGLAERTQMDAQGIRVAAVATAADRA